MIGILASLLVLASPSGSQDQPDEASTRLFLYYSGSAVALDEHDVAQVEQEIVSFFAACHEYSAVTGTALQQDELEELWRRQERRGYALLKTRGGPESRHLHLRDRDFLLMLGLEAGQGVGPILTRHNGALTSYIKCPGLGAIALSCKLLRRIPSADLWPDCDRADARGSN